MKSLTEQLAEIKAKATTLLAWVPPKGDLHDLGMIILKQNAVIEKLVEQRNGYRENYWAHCGLRRIEMTEIIEDNDAEIQRILAGEG